MGSDTELDTMLFVDNINALNYRMCGGSISDIKELERMNVDEYYSTMVTYVRDQKSKNKKGEKTNKLSN